MDEFQPIEGTNLRNSQYFMFWTLFQIMVFH